MYLEDPKEEPEVIFQDKKKKAKWTSKCMKSHGFGSITCSLRHPHCHVVQAEKRSKSGERNLGVHVQVGTAAAQMIAEDFGDTNSRGRFVEESECTCKLF